MDDFYLKVIEAFNKAKVEYLVVGGFAVNFHGYNRTTGDLDLWISNSPGNLEELNNAIDALGFSLSDEAINELNSNGIVTFSDGDFVVELLTRLNISKEVTFMEALGRSIKRVVEGVEVRVISLQDLKNEKAKSKRYKDLDDLSKLEEAEAFYGKRSEEE